MGKKLTRSISAPKHRRIQTTQMLWKVTAFFKQYTEEKQDLYSFFFFFLNLHKVKNVHLYAFTKICTISKIWKRIED